MIAAEYGAVVFDLDGTLADTAMDIREALVGALATEGLPPIDLASVRLMIGGGPRLLVQRALRSLDIAAENVLVSRLTEAFHAESVRRGNRLTALFDGAGSALRELHTKGIRLGLCSNKPDDLCRLLAGHLGIDKYLDEIMGSGDGLPKKPDPMLLQTVIGRLGVTPEDTLYVGDSETDVATARNAGVQVMLVSYGYTAQPAVQLGADGVIDSLADLVRPGPYARSA